MEKFQNFEDWLKSKHHLNWRECIIQMNSIDKILMVPDLDKISSISILNQLLSALRSNVSFASKPKTHSDKDIKTFKLFIQFKQELNAMKNVDADSA